MDYSGKIRHSQGMLYFTKCPSCKSNNTLRTSHPRNTKERILKTITWFQIFRCRKCGWRGWKLNLSIEKKVIKKIVVYILLVAIVALVVYNLLKLVV
jgi:transposase-like protein